MGGMKAAGGRGWFGGTTVADAKTDELKERS